MEDVSIGSLETSETSVPSSNVNNREATLKLEPEQTANITTNKTDEYQEQENSSAAKTVILKLLSSKLMKPSYHSADSTAVSSPCDTICRSSRNFSHDSCTTRISTISTCNSYEKLQDEFEIVSEVASSGGCATNPSTIANTPSNTPKNVIGRRRPCNDRQYPTCDLDSLYEGIKILDTYLARRSINVDHKRRSVTVMLFGTPEHGLTRDRLSQPPTRRRRMHARIWHSSEDALNITRDQST